MHVILFKLLVKCRDRNLKDMGKIYLYRMTWKTQQSAKTACFLGMYYIMLCIIACIHNDETLSWWRHQIETFSALLAICAGNSPVPVNSLHKGQWRGALMFSLICVWINGWANNREAGDLRRPSRPLWRHRNVSQNLSFEWPCVHPYCVDRSIDSTLPWSDLWMLHTHRHTHTHTYIYIYIYCTRVTFAILRYMCCLHVKALRIRHWFYNLGNFHILIHCK